MKETKRGGYRQGSGAKPKPPAEVASVRIVANVTQSEAAEWRRRGRTGWLRADLRRIGSEVLAEREACVRVVESFLDPEIDSNTSYADEVCDGLLRQVIEAMRARHVDAASLHGSAADV